MSIKPKNLTGLKFNRLTVIELHHKKEIFRKDRNRKEYKYYWLCKCECGNEKIVDGDSLKRGKTKSCGCLQKENIKQIIKNYRIKHGETNTRLYRIWQGMKARCYIKTTDNYCYYGGRGITVCKKWKNDFINFYNWAINNGYNKYLTIDRIDVNGNYEPQNCRWISHKEQMSNTSKNRYLKYKNKKRTITEWSQILDIPVATISARIDRLKWSIEKSLSTPVRKLNYKQPEKYEILKQNAKIVRSEMK